MKSALLQLSLMAFAFQANLCSAGVITYFAGPDTSKADLILPTSLVTPERNSFLASLSSYGVEDVESLTGSNPTLTFGATGITGTTGFIGGAQSFALLSVSGTKFLLDTDGVSPPSDPNESINFSRQVTAFGTYITQGGDGAVNNFSVRLENTVTGTNKLIPVATLGPGAAFANVVFFGITDTDAFNQISFIETNDFDGLLYDDLVAGDVAAVPEPASVALLAAGLAGIARYRRKAPSTRIVTIRQSAQ